MDCGCIKKAYNYDLRSADNKNLLYQDTSIWMEGPNFQIPDKYRVGVTLPTKDSPVYVDMSPKNINVLTTVELFNTSEPEKLPDGVYCFQIDENTEKAGYCGTSFYKTTAVVADLLCCRDSILATLPPESSLKVIVNLDFYIASVQINAELGKVNKAQEFFKLAKRECDKYDCACK